MPPAAATSARRREAGHSSQACPTLRHCLLLVPPTPGSSLALTRSSVFGFSAPRSLQPLARSSMAAQAEEPSRQQQQQPQAPQEPAEAKRTPWVGTTAEHCQQMVDKATSRNPMVKFMLEKMEEVRRRRRRLRTALFPRSPVPSAAVAAPGQAGCHVGKAFIQVERCEAEVGGGFRPPDGVVICHNHMASQVRLCR